MKFFFITDSPEVARFVVANGVERIFIDLETNGKQKRQKNRDTLISSHRLESIAPVKKAIGCCELMVRVNPLHTGTPREIDNCLNAGADLLMLPMFRSAEELSSFSRFVGGRASIVPLVETAEAMQALPGITEVEGVSEIFIGLNDLHLDLGLRFMFELIPNGSVDRMADCCHNAKTPFGVGGVSRVGEGLIPGELVMAEHARLGSSAVILSRSFHHRAENLADLQTKIDFPRELAKLQTAHKNHLTRTAEQISADRRLFSKNVANIIAKIA